MAYILIKDDKKIFPFDLVSLPQHFNVSFPRNFANVNLQEFGVFEVIEEAPPNFDPFTQERNKLEPELIDGVWIQKWAVTQKREDLAARAIRNRRNDLLAESDWTQVVDSPVDKAVWATYRQQLRNITLQEGFPFNIIWPDKP